MLRMKLSKVDMSIIFISLVGIGALVHVINDDKLINEILGIQIQSQKEIGKVVAAQNLVFKRARGSTLWQKVTKGQSVYEGDSLLTKSDSSATVQLLNTKGSIEIVQDSVIDFNLKENKNMVAIKTGTIFANMDANESLKVSQNGQTSEIVAKDKKAKAKLQSSSSQKGFSIRSVSGDLSVKNSQKVAELKEAEIVKIDKNQELKKSPTLVKLLKPEFNEVLWAKSKIKIPFTWTPEKGVNASYTLEIAKDQKFKKLVFKKAGLTKTRFVVTKVPAGSYYWRVKSKDSYTDIDYFTVNKIEPLELYFPIGDLKFDKSLNEITFKWQKLTQLKGYNIQIASDAGFTNIVVNKSIYKNEYLFNFSSLKKLETLYWRVRTIGNKHLDKTWSKVESFEIQEGVRRLASFTKEKTEKPIVIHEPNKTVYLKFQNIESHLAVKNPPLFSWEGVPGVVDYKVYISATKEFDDQSLKVARVKERTNFVWTGVRAGEYYWKVEPVFEAQEQSEKLTSAVGRIECLVDPVEVVVKNIKPLEFDNLDKYQQANFVPVVLWEKAPHSFNYEIELLYDGNVEWKKYSKINKFKFQEIRTGNFKVRVRPLDMNGVPIADYSGWANFKLEKALKVVAPKLVLPSSNSVVAFMAEEKREPVIFVWKKVKSADEYQIQISKDKEFSDVYVDSLNKNNNYLWVNNSQGSFYWRVRSKYGEFFSPWSSVRKLILNSSGN